MTFHVAVYGYEVVAADREAVCAKIQAINWSGSWTGGTPYPHLYSYLGPSGNCELSSLPNDANHLGGIGPGECSGPTFDCAGINAGNSWEPSYWAPVVSTGGGGSGSTTLIPPDIFNISPQGGAQIALAILAVWTVGWAFRMFIRTFKTVDGVSSTSESE